MDFCTPGISHFSFYDFCSAVAPGKTLPAQKQRLCSISYSTHKPVLNMISSSSWHQPRAKTIHSMLYLQTYKAVDPAVGGCVIACGPSLMQNEKQDRENTGRVTQA